MLFRTAVAALTLVLGSPLAAAATLIVPVSQTRTVTAFADGNPGDPSTSTFSAASFGAFDQLAGAHSQHPEGPGLFISNSVRQTSSIGDERLSAAVSASFARSEFYSGTAFTESTYDIVFDLTSPASYLLGNGTSPFSGFHTVTLRDENGQVLAQPASASYPVMSTDLLGWMSVASGVLVPGRYRLTAEWNQGFAPDPGTWNASGLLILTAIPEPGTAGLLALGLGALAAREPRSRS